jgi:NADH-quinone oxidoreductase subunit I
MKYYIDTLKGVMVTTRHLVRNVLRREKAGVVTVEYPEKKLTYRSNFRGLHRLTRRPDGSPKCVACFMCETICPAYCIHIEAEESPDGRIEKRPKVFVIDELRCVVCGLCVEACPEDALRMDTAVHPPPATERAKFLYERDVLISQKGVGPEPPATSGGGRRK